MSTGAIFGRGLNTAQPGNAVNHVSLPKLIKIKAGGVVNFTVAGFHGIIIFKPGFKREDLDPFIPAAGTFVFPRDLTAPLSGDQASLADQIYYRGINPAGGGRRPTMQRRSSRLTRPIEAQPWRFSPPGTFMKWWFENPPANSFHYLDLHLHFRMNGTFDIDGALLCHLHPSCLALTVRAEVE